MQTIYAYDTSLVSLMLNPASTVLFYAGAPPENLRAALAEINVSVITTTTDALAKATKLPVQYEDAVLRTADGKIEHIVKPRIATPQGDAVMAALFIFVNHQKFLDLNGKHTAAIIDITKRLASSPAGPLTAQDVFVGDPFSFFGLKPTATEKELRKERNRLASLYHPDQVATLGPRLREVAEQEMKRINLAYEAASALLRRN